MLTKTKLSTSGSSLAFAGRSRQIANHLVANYVLRLTIAMRDLHRDLAFPLRSLVPRNGFQEPRPMLPNLINRYNQFSKPLGLHQAVVQSDMQFVTAPTR